MDEPINDPAALPLYLLMKRIAGDGHKIVLSGEGSDELFLGYRQYFEYLDIEKAATLHHKNWLKKYFHSHFSMNREWEWYKRIFDETLLFRTSGEKFTDLQQNLLLRHNVRDNESLKFLRSYREEFEKSTYHSPSHWYSFIDLKLFVGEHFLTKLDRVSMSHTLEARAPFLDHTLAGAVFSMDESEKLGASGTKFLLKNLGKKYLNEEILTRKKKGFANPYMEWLIASERIGLIREVNSHTGLFHAAELEKYIELAHRGKFKQHTWGLYVLSHWIKKELL
jgi:asparagine synthase (glutamine-hydrolysing)